MSGWSAYQASPVTEQAVVSVNAGFDRFFCNFRQRQPNDKMDSRYVSTDDHSFTVMQRELVFRLNPKYDNLITRPAGFNGVNDMALKVFSSANRFPDPGLLRVSMSAHKTMNDFQKDFLLRDALAFVGVAKQPVDFLDTNSKDTVAVQIGGSCTIWNTGGYTIRPGQKLVWDLPLDANKPGTKRKQPAGEPAQKYLFSVAPLESVLQLNAPNHDFATALFDMHDPWSAAPTEEGKFLKKNLDLMQAQFKDSVPKDKKPFVDFARHVMILYEEVRSRVFAIALSGGAPGQQVDVMLCSGH